MFQAFGLYSHIRQNRIRSVLILIGFGVLMLALLFALHIVAASATLSDRYLPTGELLLRAGTSMRHTWIYAVAFTLMWFAIAFVVQEAMIDASVGSTLMGPATERRLRRLMEPLCISVGMTMPKLKVIETDALNAFASGFDENDAAVTVTRGLMDQLDDRELRAVLAHELTHIRNQDIRLIVIAAIFGGVISFVGEMLMRVLSGGRNGRGGNGLAVGIAFALAALSWVLAIVLRFALSRQREYLADAGAVELTKDADAMISALRKISGHSTIPDVPSLVREAFIDNASVGAFSLFATHPPIEARIDALVRFAGGQIVVADAPDRPRPRGGTRVFGSNRNPWDTVDADRAQG